MFKTQWVVTLTLLLLAVTPAFGQEEVPTGGTEDTTTDGRVEDHVANDNPDCALGPVHFEHLEGNDLKLQQQYDEIRAGLEEVRRGDGSALETTKERISKLEKDLEAARTAGTENLDELSASMTRIEKELASIDRLLRHTGWRWNFGLLGAGNFLSDYFISTRVTGGVRYIFQNRMFVEGALGFGGTFTEGAFPLNVAGHLFTGANWDYVGVFGGMELQYLQSAYKKQDDHVATFAWGGIEFFTRKLFFVRLGVGAPVFNDRLNDNERGLHGMIVLGFEDMIRSK